MAASSSKRWKRSAVKSLAWFHRWLGIATCAIFAMWFFSGGVLLFQPYPSLSAAAQRDLAPAVDASGVSVAATDALENAGASPTGVRLIERAGAPAWIVATSEGVAVVDARSGDRPPALSEADARSVIARAMEEAPANVEGPIHYDQWIVHNRFDPYRPFFRIRIGDDRKTEYYVSAVTGEILQRTHARERFWNWTGAVLHWVYFTPLRASFTAWDQTVWWLSLLATLVAAAGAILGVLRMLAARRAGRPGLTYFQPFWLKYHHLLGLFAAVFVLTWIVSGWLSMDHGRIFSRGAPDGETLSRYQGASIAEAASQIADGVLLKLPQAKEYSIHAVGGEAYIAVSGANGGEALFDALGGPVDPARAMAAFRRGISGAWSEAQISPGVQTAASDLYVAAEGMPASAVRFDIRGRKNLSVYVDADTGRILTVMDASRAAYAWTYYALHTFKFPGLIERPGLRKGLALALVAFGFVFSVTGVMIGVQRLRRTF